MSEAALRRKLAEAKRSHAREVKGLRRDLQRARLSGEVERQSIRAAAAPMIARIRATEAALAGALRACAELGPEALAELDDLAAARGLRGVLRRLRWGVRFALTGRVVRG
jgi:hypothetical protein